MNDIQNHNLDYLAARHAQKVVKDLSADPKKAENSLTKALGVLQENGVYACFLYLYASEGKNGESIESIAANMLQMFKSLQFPETPAAEKDKVLKYIAEKITADLPTLLLAKEALEQMLIYARYGAKAAGKS